MYKPEIGTAEESTKNKMYGSQPNALESLCFYVTDDGWLKCAFADNFSSAKIDIFWRHFVENHMDYDLKKRLSANLLR